MEFGRPPLYQALNVAQRTNDLQHVDTLGPFAYALLKVLKHAEQNKIKEDRYTCGDDIGRAGALGDYSGTFVLFRGGYLKPEWIEDYRTYIRKKDKRGDPAKLILPGIFSCTEDFSHAIK